MIEKANVLIVEDEKLTSLVLQKKLTNLGYNVCGSVMRGIDAIEEAGSKKPDIVLMDIQLKGDMDGIEAANVIKERYSIPVIFVTAYSDSGTVERAKLTGPFGYIIKPVNEKDLVTNIEIALYKHKIEIELKESQLQLRELTGKLQSIREEERKNIAREIHDELGQMLTCLKIDSIWVNKKIDPSQVDTKSKVESMIEMIDQTIGTVRKISSDLRPSILDDLGLIPAIEWHTEEFEKRTGISCNLDINSTVNEIDPEKAIHVFRILQETLTNISRHSKARNVDLILECDESSLKMIVRDDGIGFTSSGNKRKSLGILGMKERANLIGANLIIESNPDNGTQVHLNF